MVLTATIGRGGLDVIYRALDRHREETDDRETCFSIKILSEDFKRHPKAFIAPQREASKSQSLAYPKYRDCIRFLSRRRYHFF